ncbi:hypothetical protein [Asanoa ferruginea]|uniref:hypothetical protein n=1 Tax=Asanoa ferruginea TaxID=53367 RepID=UPI001941758B|nr:hypothetical protein [Asanoa ferruginea]
MAVRIQANRSHSLFVGDAAEASQHRRAGFLRQAERLRVVDGLAGRPPIGPNSTVPVTAPQLEVEVGRTVEDPVHAGRTGDHWEDRQHLDGVDQVGVEQRPVEHQAPVGALRKPDSMVDSPLWLAKPSSGEKILKVRLMVKVTLRGKLVALRA